MSHVKKVNRFIPKKGVSLISMTLSLPSCPFGLINVYFHASKGEHLKYKLQCPQKS